MTKEDKQVHEDIMRQLGLSPAHVAAQNKAWKAVQLQMRSMSSWTQQGVEASLWLLKCASVELAFSTLLLTILQQTLGDGVFILSRITLLVSAPLTLLVTSYVPGLMATSPFSRTWRDVYNAEMASDKGAL